MRNFYQDELSGNFTDALNKKESNELNKLAEETFNFVMGKLKTSSLKDKLSAGELLLFMMSSTFSQIMQKIMSPTDTTIRTEMFRDFNEALHDISVKMFFAIEALHAEAKGKIN